MLTKNAISTITTTCPTCNASRITHLDFASDRTSLISGCRGCGLVFVNPLPLPHEVEAHYAPGGLWSYKVDKRREGLEARKALKDSQGERTAVKRWVFDAAASLYEEGARDVLDYGCEQGGMLDKLQRKGWSTFGIDPNTRDTILRHKMLNSLPDEPSFDLIIMRHVLEHLRDPLSVLRATRKAIREGGHLFVGTPTLDGLATHTKKSYCVSQLHITAYTARSLRHLLALAGFRCVRRMPSARPYRMAFVFQASRPTHGLFWPLWSAQREFHRIARRNLGAHGWLPFHLAIKRLMPIIPEPLTAEAPVTSPVPPPPSPP